MNVLLVLPVLIPLATAILALLAHRSPRAQAALGVTGAAALLAAAVGLFAAVSRGGVMAVQMGSWPAPMGITLVADTLAALMVLLAAITGLAVSLYAVADIGAERREAGFYPLLHALLLGVCCAFITGDAFNLYVCFEIMLMASFVLLAMGGERPQLEGSLKYVTLNLIASALFLSALGVLYGLTGTLNLAHLAVVVPEVASEHPALISAVAGLFLVSFGIKAGLFPLYSWLPSSYHTPPVSVSAIFAGLLTKVGVYALLRFYTLVFAGQTGQLQLILILSAVTMLVGVLGAVAQYHVRRVLSFHIISQIGYMVVGLGLLASDQPEVRRLGLLAAVFYVAHHIIVKTNLFLIGGLIKRLAGGEQLRGIGGLYKARPWLAALFLVPALSLAGIPPLSGFWAKLAVFRAGLAAEAWLVVAVAVLAGVFTLMSMIKIWNEAFWKDAPAEAVPERRGLGWLVPPVVGLAVLTVLIGVMPGWLLDVAERAASELLDTGDYLRAVGVWSQGGPS